jgi:hypothetical protein
VMRFLNWLGWYSRTQREAAFNDDTIWGPA